jgi:hypothetical protein
MRVLLFLVLIDWGGGGEKRINNTKNNDEILL